MSTFGTINEYLDWRGDLSFEQSAFNVVDALVLAEMIYVDFSDIMADDEVITIKEAADRFDRLDLIKDEKYQKTFIQNSPYLLLKLRNIARFKDLKLTNYIDEFDAEIVQQFAGVCVEISPDLNYVVFRGTDSTLVGWKEDLYMPFMKEVPSQERAVYYLDNLEKSSFFDFFKPKKKYIIGGHSKGGNLAVYSASFCKERIRERIVKVYSFDGPGFHQKIINSPGYQSIVDRVDLFVPEASLFGLLMEQRGNKYIIRSNNNNLFSHSGFTWLVAGNDLVYSDNDNAKNEKLIATYMESLKDFDFDEGKEFVDNLFQLFELLNIRMIGDISKVKLVDIPKAISQLTSLEPRNRALINDFVQLLIRVNLPNNSYFSNK